MRILLTFYSCIFFIFFSIHSLFSQSVYVPLNHRVYRFIERFEAKGILKNDLMGTKPLTRLHVGELLYGIHRSQAQGTALSKVDSDFLTFYEQEFREEIESIDPGSKIEQPEVPEWFGNIRSGMLPGIIYENGRNLLEIKSDKFNLFADIIAFQDNAVTDIDSLDSFDEVYQYTAGVRLRGSIGERLGFFIDARNTKEWGNRFYPEGNSMTAPGLGWVSNRITHQFHDETIAYIIFRLSNFEFELGKNLNNWGPRFRGGLLLSNNATSYDLLKVKTKIWRLTFSHLFGSLVQFPRIVEQEFEGLGGKKRFSKKYIAAHRLEINVFDGINLGLQESVVYGQREIELAYLNPVMFLRSAEHFLGDQDNALMGADITINLIDGWKWYGELLMDDIFISRLGTKWWGNKFGYVAGTLWEDPLGATNTSLRLEYTRIKPFVYTHRFPINVYKQYNTGLGHVLEPNSDELYLAFNQQINRKLVYSAEYVYARHGKSDNGRIVGGNIDEPFPNENDEFIGFLEGSVEKLNWLRLKLSYEIFRNLFLSTEYEIRSGSNFYIRGKQEQDFHSNRFLISTGLNY